jgi:hypothetical protein
MIITGSSQILTSGWWRWIGVLKVRNTFFFCRKCRAKWLDLTKRYWIRLWDQSPWCCRWISPLPSTSDSNSNTIQTNPLLTYSLKTNGDQDYSLVLTTSLGSHWPHLLFRISTLPSQIQQLKRKYSFNSRLLLVTSLNLTIISKIDCIWMTLTSISTKLILCFRNQMLVNRLFWIPLTCSTSLKSTNRVISMLSGRDSRLIMTDNLSLMMLSKGFTNTSTIWLTIRWFTALLETKLNQIITQLLDQLLRQLSTNPILKYTSIWMAGFQPDILLLG